jgi:hypothetical protein
MPEKIYKKLTKIFFVTSERIIKGDKQEKAEHMTPFVPHENFAELITMPISPAGRVSEIFKTLI